DGALQGRLRQPALPPADDLRRNLPGRPVDRALLGRNPAQPQSAARAGLSRFQLRRNLQMKLGAFSVSLAVKDIAASRAFYEKLGFTAFGGNQDQRWLIMKNE